MAWFEASQNVVNEKINNKNLEALRKFEQSTPVVKGLFEKIAKTPVWEHLPLLMLGMATHLSRYPKMWPEAESYGFKDDEEARSLQI